MSTTAISSTKPLVKTAKVQGRRELHFANLDEILADGERLAAARNLKSLGNWTLGQALGHLACAMDTAVDGVKNPPPWIFRVMGRMFKNKVLKRMDPGFKLPDNAAKELIPPPSMTTEEGLRRLRTAIARLKVTPNRAPSPFLGRLTTEESNRLQCSHAELHLSFFVP
ncbi:MAG TPA: DUF1569 domain-containing protein [Pirellulales bacterium]|nr:DUF1569 domain-containing protein [Pirellulales bacterium]